jgi:serine/threonine protein phosphatase PrpC
MMLATQTKTQQGALSTRSVALTDVGRRRANNEDSFVADDDLSMYLVGDGVGGCASGEVASAEAVAIVHSLVQRRRATIDGFVQNPSRKTEGQVSELLERSVQSASRIVFGMGQLDPLKRGMASTLSSLLVAGQTGFIAQVGDSRVYLARQQRCLQLTHDHTLANERAHLGLAAGDEAALASAKHIITRCVGYHETVSVDMLTVPIEPGDRFLICSDGLHGYLGDGELDHLVAGRRADVAERLLALANRRGGRDNITLIVCDVTA